VIRAVEKALVTIAEEADVRGPGEIVGGLRTIAEDAARS